MAWVSQPSERLDGQVCDVPLVQGWLESDGIKLRIVAGHWDRADINDLLDLVRFDDLDELIDGACGVADGEDAGLGHGRGTSKNCTGKRRTHR